MSICSQFETINIAFTYNHYEMMENKIEGLDNIDSLIL